MGSGNGRLLEAACLELVPDRYNKGIDWVGPRGLDLSCSPLQRREVRQGSFWGGCGQSGGSETLWLEDANASRLRGATGVGASVRLQAWYQACLWSSARVSFEIKLSRPFMTAKTDE